MAKSKIISSKVAILVSIQKLTFQTEITALKYSKNEYTKLHKINILNYIECPV